MDDKAEVTHFRIVDEHSTVHQPAGVLHREIRDGTTRDKTLSFRVGGGWRETDGYADAPVDPETGPGLYETTAETVEQLVRSARLAASEGWAL